MCQRYIYSVPEVCSECHLECQRCEYGSFFHLVFLLVEDRDFIISVVTVFIFKNLVQFCSVFCENHNFGTGFIFSKNGKNGSFFSICADCNLVIK